MQHHRTISAITVGSSLLLSSCSWFTPLSRALRQLSTARSVTIKITEEFYTIEHSRTFKIDGNKLSIQDGDNLQVMVINTWMQRVDVYTQDWNKNWDRITVSFDEIDFDPDTDSMNFAIPGSWVVADETDDKKFWIIDEHLDSFSEYSELTQGLEDYDPTIASVALYITSEGEFDEMVITIDSTLGNVSLSLDFRDFNQTTVTIPDLVGD